MGKENYIICPFCAGKVKVDGFKNHICQYCGSKYYIIKKQWLNRATGEYRS